MAAQRKEVIPIAKPISSRYTKMTINIDPELRKAFKAAAVLKGVDMTEVVLEFIEDYVKQNLPAAVLPKRGRK